MLKKDARIGMIVRVQEHFDYKNIFAGQVGKIVSIENAYDDGYEVGIEFDDPSDLMREVCHNCGGSAKEGHGYYGWFDEIEPIAQIDVDVENLELKFDDLF